MAKQDTTCPTCGGPVFQTDERGRPAKFCSEYCRRKMVKQRERVRRVQTDVLRDDPTIAAWLDECGR